MKAHLEGNHVQLYVLRHRIRFPIMLASIFLGIVVGFLLILLLPLLSPEPSPLISPLVRAYESPVYVSAPEIVVVAKTARVTAYSCGGLKTDAEIRMNCPSLLSGGPKTASGTIPRPYVTVACDRSYLGKRFEVEGIGTVVCEDTGGAIKGEGRFDLYVSTVQEAREWGVRTIEYSEKL